MEANSFPRSHRALCQFLFTVNAVGVSYTPVVLLYSWTNIREAMPVGTHLYWRVLKLQIFNLCSVIHHPSARSGGIHFKSVGCFCVVKTRISIGNNVAVEGHSFDQCCPGDVKGSCRTRLIKCAVPYIMSWSNRKQVNRKTEIRKIQHRVRILGTPSLPFKHSLILTFIEYKTEKKPLNPKWVICYSKMHLPLYWFRNEKKIANILKLYQ